MKLGQFCALVCDTMGIRHSDFLGECEVLFAEDFDGKSDEFVSPSASLPDRDATVRDAAMLVFLVVADEFHGYDGQMGTLAWKADWYSELGENTLAVMQAIQNNAGCSIDLSPRLETLVSIPEKLIAALSRVVCTSTPVKLKSV